MVVVAQGPFRSNTCTRYQKPMQHYLWRYENKDADAIRFKTDQEIFLSGLGLYGSPEGGEYSIEIKILLNDATVFKQDSVFMCPPDPEFSPLSSSHSPAVHDIRFDDPFKISKDTFYDICVLLEGPPSFAGDGGLKEVVAEGVGFVFENCMLSSNGTSYDEGQIPALLFTRGE